MNYDPEERSIGVPRHARIVGYFIMLLSCLVVIAGVVAVVMLNK